MTERELEVMRAFCGIKGQGQPKMRVNGSREQMLVQVLGRRKLPKSEHQTAPPFALNDFAPWDTVQPNDTGFIAVRVEKLLEHPLFGVALPAFANPFLDIAWKTISTEEAAGKCVAVGLSLENVQHMIASMISVSRERQPD